MHRVNLVVLMGCLLGVSPDLLATPVLDGWQESLGNVVPGGVPSSTWWETQSVTPTHDYLSSVDFFINPGSVPWNATVEVYGQTADNGTSLSSLLGSATLALNQSNTASWYSFDFSNIDISGYTDTVGTGRLLLALKSDDAGGNQRFVYGAGDSYGGGQWRYTPNSGGSFVSRNADMTFRLYTDTGANPVPSTFVQDRFAIGYWNTVPVDDRLDEHFAEIADAHFTLAIAGYTHANAEQELAMIRKYDLRALFWRGNEAIMSAPEVWGRVLDDEPNASLFADLKQQSEGFKQAFPDKLAYINLYPNYASQQQLGTQTYAQYVDSYMQQINPEVLSMDHYPRFPPGGDTRENFLDNLDVMRRNANEAGISFWNYVNVTAFGPYADPTESQVRWQVFTSLAYGSKGIVYFTYYAPSFAVGGAILDRNGEKTRHYAEVQRINAQVKALGPTLMQLTNNAVHRVEGQADEQVFDGTIIRSIENAQPFVGPLDLIIGFFDHTDERQAVLVTNNYFERSTWMTIDWAVEVVEVDLVTGLEVLVYDENQDLDGVQISLNPGAGRLFIAKPVPEPAGALLFSVAVGALLMSRRSR